MERRDFLKACGCFGLAASSPLGAFAGNPAPYRGPLLVVIQAIGGWDPTMMFDPKPHLSTYFGDGDIETAGNIRYVSRVPGADAFYNDHFERMVCINGVKMSTNNHAVGPRYAASGRLGVGYPNVAALHAAAQDNTLPMAYIAFGQGASYEDPAGVVAPVKNFDAGQFTAVAYPESMDEGDPNGPRFRPAGTQAILDAAVQTRIARQIDGQGLPRYRSMLSTLEVSRMGASGLRALEDTLPPPSADLDEQRIQMVLAAYRAGIAAGASLRFAAGAFDSHTDHDASHPANLERLMGFLGFVWQEAERQGAAADLTVLVCSDFGRTPNYNSQAGKDHWPVGSMLVMSERVAGNQVIGFSDDGHEAGWLDPESLEPTTEAEGIQLEPEHVHENLRRLLGIEGSPAAEAFPLGSGYGVDLFA